MLIIFDEFRRKLDDIMVKCIHDRILLYGYGYSGRFIKWYAEYYHNIIVDHIISTDMTGSQAYDKEIFRPSLFNFNYKDVSKCIIWVTEPLTEDIRKIFQKEGYVENKTYYDFCEHIYGNQQYNTTPQSENIFEKFKYGKRDIQFLEWLELKYNCNFVTAIDGQNFIVAGEHGASYRCSSQKEIFPVLDKCHCIPKVNDAIFDFGCGKGGAMISFLDYGFEKVGGVEYEPAIFDILKDNQQKLGLTNNIFEIFQDDAANLTYVLDTYNYFYFFQPFDNYIYQKCIDNICSSYKRIQRKIRIISLNPICHNYIEQTGIFRLTNQFTIDTRQRVVDIYETY